MQKVIKMLHEIYRTLVTFTKHEEPSIKWCNSVLSVRIEKGVHLFEFDQNLQCLDRNLSLSSMLLPRSKNCVLKELVSENFLKKIRNNLEIGEMIQNPSLWPHNADIVEEMAGISDIQWSPVGMAHNNECVLATLSSLGNVELFSRGRFGWQNIFDLSNAHRQRLESSNSLISPKNLEQLKTLAGVVETTAICWGPKLRDYSAFFAMAQKNGNILIWRLDNEDEMKATFLGDIQTDTEVFAMSWIQMSESNFLLIYSNTLGQTFGANFSLEDLHGVNISSLWTCKDKMVAKSFCYQFLGDKLVLVYSKHRHLIIQMLDANCNIISQFIDKINDYRITDLVSTSNGVYLTTMNCEFYKINLDVRDNNLQVTFNAIKIKDIDANKYVLHGFAFSSNQVITALAIINTEVAYRKVKTGVDIVFFVDPAISEINVLIENPTKTLGDYWDCIKLFRYKVMKNRSLPQINYTKLFEDSDTDLYKLKVYLVIAYLYNNLEQVARIGERVLIPETSIERVKETILAFHASEVLSELFEIYKNSGKKLKDLHLESYSGAKNYLKYYCEKYSKNMTEYATAKVLNLNKTKVDLICQCCDDKIQGIQCKHGHLNMFCSITFTLIDNDEYLFCEACESVARIELYKNSPKCVFCDLYLRKV